jgi:acetyltransferase-like isoleucine patch superfamily enzyme
LLGKLANLLRAVRLRTYDQRSICTYFRSQGAKIGEGCRIMVRDLGTEPYLVEIGNDVLVSCEVLFITHDGATWVGRDADPKLNAFGKIKIGDRCFIGARSMLLPGTTMGDRCIVGAGAVCKGEYPAGSVIAGVPGKVVGSTEDFLERAKAKSLDLPPEVFPLNGGDRELLKSELLGRL